MPLFQRSVVKKYIQDINKERLSNAWNLFQTHFHNPQIQQNILNAKEEEYQEGFVRDLFVNVLGFTLKPQPDFNLVLEQKSTTDATKSDGAILKAGNVTSVIELKDTSTTDLAKVEKQAFGYKHQHKDCIYIITSNFEKLRLYINDAVEFEEFDLFRLTKDHFDILYCCLQCQAVLNDVPLKIKQQSLSEEENITNKLYADYSRFKKQLFKNISERNNQYNRLDLYKKTQKLLDRFLFILFAEDRLLVPPNSVREILSQWEKLKELDNYVPLYDRFKKYFGYLNEGYQGKLYEIFAYNGGLFAHDDILDTINIDDDILYESCKTLSNYDFESEVDVNILGHIFEHSLNEIEEVERGLLNTANAETNKESKKASKRKKDGVFYTPKYITKYIVENTVGTLCNRKKEELNIIDEVFEPQKRKSNRKQLLSKLEAYRKWLLKITICDPACGSGAFLNQALEFLINEHKIIDELTAKLFGDAMVLSDVETSILENNLYGVDINEEAVEIARLSLWLRTARKGRKLNNLSQHIKSGNSLIEDVSIADEKAFNWKEQFTNVFDNGGFDVIIGNPPYVRVQNLKSLEVDYFFSKYKSPSGKLDIAILFFEKAIELINSRGLFSFISSSQWMQTDYGKNIRNILSSDFLYEIVDFGSLPVFQDADTYPAIFTCSKVAGRKLIYVNIKSESELNFNSIKLKKGIVIDKTGLSDSSWNFSTFDLITFLKKNKILFSTVDGIGGCYVGDLTGMDEAFVVNDSQISNSQSKILFPYYYRGEEIERYIEVNTKNRVIYPYVENDEGQTELINEDLFKENFGEPYAYLLKYKDALMERLDSRKKYALESNWYRHLRAGTFEYISPAKIILKGIGVRVTAALIPSNTIFNGANCPAIINNNPEVSNIFLLTILNSTLITYFLNSICPKKLGGYFRYNVSNINKIPLVINNNQDAFISRGEIIISRSKELFTLRHNLLQLLNTKFPSIKFTNKLYDWPNIEVGKFLTELKKQKIKLDLSEQAEWMQYFESEKSKALVIQKIIDDTDKEIDRMVYELYNLTEDEIKIIESN